MDRRPIWTDCDEAGDYIVPNVLSPRDLVFRPDNMDETVPHTYLNSYHWQGFIIQNCVHYSLPEKDINFRVKGVSFLKHNTPDRRQSKMLNFVTSAQKGCK